MISRLPMPLFPNGTRKCKGKCSDSIRSKGLEKDHDFNVRWLHAARRVLKPDGTLWVSGTHHIIFSIGFALQRLGFKVINNVAWFKPNATPNALHTAFTHAHETLIWASKGARHTFNYDLINSPNPGAQLSSVWRIRTVPKNEKLHGHHPTQKPLRLVRRALLASSREGDLIFDPFCGSGTTAVAAKELGSFFVGAELEEEFCELAARRIGAAVRGSLSREISEQRWSARVSASPMGPETSTIEVVKTKRRIRMGDTPINIAYPSAEDLRLRIALGACRFEARPGEGDAWVTGTCHDPTDGRSPSILEEGGSVTITEAEPSFERIPAVFGGVPRYELEVGKARPFALTIETGASEFDLDLGGVPVNRLIVRQGAGKFELGFSVPNPKPMELLEVSSGAAGIELVNLANANFSEMRLSGGAASYELDFGGTLSRDARVSIETGLSGAEISVPAATAARVVAETTLGSVDVGDGFTKREGAFLTEGALSREAPVLEIRAGVRLGSLQLRAT